MARPRKSAQKLDVYETIRVDEFIRDEAEFSAKKQHISKVDAHRQASAIGFRFLRLIDYDVSGAVVEKALRVLEQQGKARFPTGK